MKLGLNVKNSGWVFNKANIPIKAVINRSFWVSCGLTRKPEICLAGQTGSCLPAWGTYQATSRGTCHLLPLTSWPWARSACKARHLQLRDQFTGATSAFTPWKKFSRLFGSFSIPDKISKFGLVGYAVVSLPSPPPAGTCQCSYPARWAPHASCPVGSPLACDLPQTSFLPWRGSTSRNLEPWPCSREASQVLMSGGICQRPEVFS